jgi:hypothetical protein
MYYVYHGYVGPDNHDASDGPVYELTECETEEDVLGLRADFDANINGETSHVIFRVIEGKERKLEPKERVTSWRLK